MSGIRTTYSRSGRSPSGPDAARPDAVPPAEMRPARGASGMPAAASHAVELDLLDAPALPWRLRPHFLFNTLNAIAQLVRKSEPDRAVTLVATLGDMLQRSLEAPTGEVALRDELAFLPRYAAIEEARYERPIELRVEAGLRARGARVPVFVLQPLVEDLARHAALAGTVKPRLRVRAVVRGRMLEVQLRADGAGVGGPRDPLCASTGCPAVAELRDRLARRYGRAHGLAMLTERDGVGLARLRIPLYDDAGQRFESARHERDRTANASC